MIKNFGDHAANERTFLAWVVRTAIAVMAFGFIVEKFDLFLEIAAPQLAGRALSLPGQKFGNIAGLALIVLGTAMVAIAAVRFLSSRRATSTGEDMRQGRRIADRRGARRAADPLGKRAVHLFVARPRRHRVRRPADVSMPEG